MEVNVAMRIGDGGIGRVAQGYTENVRSSARDRARGGQTTSSDAYRVTLSDLGRDMALARHAMEGVTTVRQELVSGLKQAVTDGAYQVSDDDIAGKIADQLRQKMAGLGG
jgi:flagellar biosynthesis anti-sigma factor FlgM